MNYIFCLVDCMKSMSLFPFRNNLPIKILFENARKAMKLMERPSATIESFTNEKTTEHTIW